MSKDDKLGSVFQQQISDMDRTIQEVLAKAKAATTGAEDELKTPEKPAKDAEKASEKPPRGTAP